MLQQPSALHAKILARFFMFLYQARVGLHSVNIGSCQLWVVRWCRGISLIFFFCRGRMIERRMDGEYGIDFFVWRKNL